MISLIFHFMDTGFKGRQSASECTNGIKASLWPLRVQASMVQNLLKCHIELLSLALKSFATLPEPGNKAHINKNQDALF